MAVEPRAVSPWRVRIAGNNGSAFFFRLHPGAKSAMAEILVLDQCERRPPLVIGGFFHDRERAM
jgi:hypothetical protein